MPAAPEGTSVPDENGKYDQAEVDALVTEKNTALEANRNAVLLDLANARKSLKNYEGIDPAEHARLKQEVADAEAKKASEEGNWKAVEKQLIEKHGTERESDKKALAKRDSAVERRLVQAELTRAIAAKKGDPDLLLPYAQKYARVRETDDDFEAFLCDERGTPMVSDGKGTPMTFDAFVEQVLMVKFPRAFDGVGSSGGGAPRSNAGGGGQARVVVTDTNSPEFLANVKDLASGKASIG